MTTQSNLSPFGSNNDINQNPIPESIQGSANTSFRTMQDDLKSLQNKGIEIKEPTSGSFAVNQNPIISTPKTIPNQDHIQTPNIQQNSSTQINQVFPTLNKELPQKESLSSGVEQGPFSAVPKKELSEVMPEKITASNENTTSVAIKIVYTVIIILIIAILALGGYYFFLTNKPKNKPVITEQNQIPSVEVPAEKPAETPITPKSVEEQPIVVSEAPKYSAEKPNYLPININEEEETGIMSSFLKTAEELKTLSATKPYEFIVVDGNNNPIAFPIFATAAKINLSPALLSSLGEKFSVYFYNDNSEIRLAISSEIKKKDVLQKEILKQEKTFVTDASFLFLNNRAEITTGGFKTSNYNGQAIKYFNVSTTKNLSLDYMITDNSLIIATSKNTGRSVLDKISSETSQQTMKTNSPTNISTSQTNYLDSSATTNTPTKPATTR